MDKLRKLQNKADMIVNGYAFTRENDQIRILNLNNLDKALVISADGRYWKPLWMTLKSVLFWIIGIVTVNLWRMKMPKYYQDKICGYYLYFTSFCTVECMHVHASDRKLTEEGSAKFFC